MMHSNDTGNHYFTDKVLESYSIVLSVTILVIALIFGTGGNFIVFFSLHNGNLLKHRQYFIMASLLLTGLVADIIWCPVEIVNLLKYQHGDENLNGSLKIVSPTIYICLLVLLTFIIALISFECVWKLTKCCSMQTWNTLSVVALILAIIITICVTIIYSITTADNEVIYNLLFTTVNKHSFCIRLTTLSLCVGILLAIILLLFAVSKMSDHSKSESNSSASEKQGMFNVPALMIGGDDGDSGEPCIDDTTPKLLPSPNQLLVQDSTFSDEEDDCIVGDLKPLGKSKNVLGVDMNKILGRRRHTICQIGETETPQEKAKKYNYVRKFSVDITALQAQLENPKLFAEKPFTSESDLLKQKKDKGEENTSEEKPLSFVLNAKLAPLGTSNVGTRVTGIKESLGEEEEEEKVDADIQSTKSELECPSEAAIESHQTDFDCCMADSSKRLIKFICLLPVTFVCCVLPMLITESLKGRLSRNAYVNIITCTIAFSVTQTVIYPHILFYMDGKIHKLVRELIQKLKQRLLCQKDINDNSNMKNIQIDVTQL